jgi:branched-chain amino acid transport system ATP-binding protein
MALLSVEHVKRRFGGILALDDVSLEQDEGTIAGLIGPNGAGKTTLFNVITRLYRPDEGRVAFDGDDLLRVRAHAVVGLGIARTFQNVALFHLMTVLENVLVGAHARLGWRGERQARADALEALDYLGLGALAGRPAAGLPFGTLKRIELARALVSRPRLLLLDEPAGGLNHEEVADLAGLIGRIRADYDLTILLVEHHMNLVMSVSERVHVLNFGRKIAEGLPAEVRANPQVIEAYLGATDENRQAETGLTAAPESNGATA